MQTKNTDIVVRKLDLSSLKSVRQFAQEINQTEPRLDILIHNAGMANTFGKTITEDGLEITMATNQYGPFLLTHLLIGESDFIVHIYSIDPYLRVFTNYLLRRENTSTCFQISFLQITHQTKFSVSIFKNLKCILNHKF